MIEEAIGQKTKDVGLFSVFSIIISVIMNFQGKYGPRHDLKFILTS